MYKSILLVTGYEKGEGSWPLSLDKGIMEEVFYTH